MNQPDADDRFIHLFRAGTSLLAQGKSAEALTFLEEAYRLRPQHADLRLNLSGAYILEKKFRRAVRLLKELSKEQPDNPQVWQNLGAAYLGNRALATTKHQMRAIEAFEQALELDPAAPNVAYNIGLIYRDRGEEEEAARWFRRAIQANPRDQDARRLLRRLTDPKHEGNGSSDL